MIFEIKSSFPEFSHLEESVLELANHIRIWQVTAFDLNGNSVGTGFSRDRESAQKIAIAEFIERRFVEKMRNSPEASKWMLKSNPTSCGFAAGFDSLNTKIRSIGEAIERWALSQWYDNQCSLQVCDPSWPMESVEMVSQFEDIQVFRKSFIYEVESQLINYELCFVVAFKGLGAFVGSAVRNDFGSALSHAIVEAHRHLLISQQDRNFDIFPFNRIQFFASHSQVAMEILKRERSNPWPKPVIEFQESHCEKLFCITRTILKDWKVWEQGPLNRMLY